MKIVSEYEESKYNEIVYTLFRDIDDIVTIIDKSKKDKIILEFSTDNKFFEFSSHVLFDMQKQKQAMSKSGLLLLYNKNIEWGALVGMRPTKLVYKFLEQGKNFSEIRKILTDIYLVSASKIDLLIEIVKNSMDYIDKKTVGVYIGIAFCPTKCTYCSFPAYLKQGKYAKIYDEYIKTLITEIKEVALVLKEKQVKINTMYIGGGTPSFLSYDELELLLKTINDNFDLTNIKEYTFEAGRIDTLDEIKLKMLREYKVDRISINPQSFKEKTLKLVNRYHNIDKLNEIYTISKSLGFIINMDYILSLPKENTQDILETIEKMKDYDAHNITIHNLALKKASYLNKSKYELDENIDFELVYKKIYEFMNEYDYIPYYMYKQKNSFGENIGFCKKTYQSIYNIDMIEENKNIFGIGAGSITKLIDKDDIKRIVMPKDPISYVLEFKDRIEKKKEIIKLFYGKK
ncbi:coproporphyrinogen III oxidase [Oceanivirga salmonicida]|uniref:coproporphyrinogen III oxidase n=1 Tax=Oceanivirga salmonicida TaxID=1769291 RepID=UPI00082F2AFB|nr:coproporphyrinogen III oxidase [Oceanivirga salmonicida]